MTIYLASPLITRSTDRYARFVALISARFPGEALIQAKDLFASVWDAQVWQETLREIDILVFIRNAQHAIGLGTWREVDEARQAGKLVYMAHLLAPDETLGLVPYDQLTLRFNERSYRHYVIVKRTPAPEKCDRM